MIVAREIPLDPGALNVLLVLGVNGVGKTTTIAKLAHHFRAHRGMEKILLVAGDTFRAAAIDQLKLLGERLGLPGVAQEPGADPGSVIYDGIASAAARGSELVIADTAGRLHNKDALVKELAKIDKIVRARVEGGSYQQGARPGCDHGAELPGAGGGVPQGGRHRPIVLAKCDSTAKGGMVVPDLPGAGRPVLLHRVWARSSTTWRSSTPTSTSPPFSGRS